MISKLMPATGFSHGAFAETEHAEQAVRNALIKYSQLNSTPTSEQSIGSVLLFLTNGYAHNPQATLRAAARAAGTPSIFGCCASVLVSEQQTLTDVDGAVAMVFPREHGLSPLSVAEQNPRQPDLALTLSSPNAAEIAVNSTPLRQIGAISSDEYGEGPYSIWQSGRISEKEFAHIAFPAQTKVDIVRGTGVKNLSPVMQINRASPNALLEVDQLSALDSLMHHLPAELQSLVEQNPFNILAAISEDNNANSIENEHFELSHLMAVDSDSKQLSLSHNPRAGRYLQWVIRDQTIQHEDLISKLELAKQKNPSPKFALIFSSISQFSSSANSQPAVDLLKETFPDLPFLGFFGQAEIAPGLRTPGSINLYSTTIAIFS